MAQASLMKVQVELIGSAGFYSLINFKIRVCRFPLIFDQFQG